MPHYPEIGNFPFLFPNMAIIMPMKEDFSERGKLATLKSLNNIYSIIQQPYLGYSLGYANLLNFKPGQHNYDEVKMQIRVKLHIFQVHKT